MPGSITHPKKGDKIGHATYNGISWTHRTMKIVNDGEKYKTEYDIKKGFASADEANENYDICRRTYEQDARRYGLATCIDGKIKFDEYLIYFYDQVLAPNCESSTRVVYSYALYKYILPGISQSIELGLVNGDYLNDLLDTIADDSSRTVASKAREFILLALKKAQFEKHIRIIPEIKTFPRKKKKITRLNRAQVKALLCEARRTDWYLEILLALFMGLRKGEILGLKFSDIDKTDRTLLIDSQLSLEVELEEGGYRSKSYKKVEKAPKTDKSVRALHIPDLVWVEFENRANKIEKEKADYKGEYYDDGFVSCQGNGESRGISSLNTALTKMCKRAGLPHISVHGLRHLYATILLEQGYSLQICSAMLGHESILTTFEYYSEIMDAGDEVLTYWNELYQEAK